MDEAEPWCMVNQRLTARYTKDRDYDILTGRREYEAEAEAETKRSELMRYFCAQGHHLTWTPEQFQVSTLPKLFHVPQLFQASLSQ